MRQEQQILSDITTWMKYSKFIPEKNRRETWEELVTRNKNMHIEKFPKLEPLIEQVYEAVYDKKVLPSMRSLQFGGKAIEVNPVRLFNCSYLPIDHFKAFSETMFLLLSGTGVGYSVRNADIENLPAIAKQEKAKKYLVGDSIEGWADAIKVLMKSYFGLISWKPRFDFRSIRAKGERLITSGGVAPGPEPLKVCLSQIEAILSTKKDGEKLTSLECHDILCHIADAVLSGGIRRSAMISLFDLDDQDMLTCKFGNWWEVNPQRGRANNSAVMKRGEVTKDQFLDLWKKVELSNSGEPGIFFTNDDDSGINPCAEIALRPNQFCNLVEINASDVEDQDDLNYRAHCAAVIGTLQASYTDFHYLRSVWKNTTEKEALLGIGMTGIASGKVQKLDLKRAASVANLANQLIAEQIGINEAYRITCVKPSGTSSLVLGTSSGIHAWHDQHYIRRIRVGKNEAMYTYLSVRHPELLEDDVFKPDTQAVISVPQMAPEGSVLRSEENAIEFLERVKDIHERWVKPGHVKGNNTHNVSATVTIKQDEWSTVGEWLWENQDSYAGLSFLPEDLGTYVQTPFETITKEQYDELVGKIHDIDVKEIVEMEDNTTLKENLACAGGNCEI
jgi:ribonucleoside-triphosphate reductase (thioredoxin)